MTRRSFFLCFLVMIFSLSLLVGCKDGDGSGYLFKYSLANDPDNLDPLVTSDKAAIAVISNMYSGLVTMSGTGEIKNELAKEYHISEDGTTYTFTLRDDNYWVDNKSNVVSKVTADDFIFAFQRMFDKSTASSYADEFMNIKNASEVYNNEADKNSLGVKKNGDLSLVIELQEPDSNFLALLSTIAALPCNEDFFYSTKGKYGLDEEFTLSNGPFYLKQWEYDPYGKENFLILRKNRNYSSSESVMPSSINFFIQKDSTQIYKDFTGGVTDSIFLDSAKKSDLQGKYNSSQYQDMSYGLVFGSESAYFTNDNLRKALGYSINRDENKYSVPNDYSFANAIIPHGISILNKSYRELVSENDKALTDTELSKKYWQNGLNDLAVAYLQPVKLIVPDNYKYLDILNNITKQWQENLNFYCGIDILPRNDYNKKLSSGDFDIAFYEISAEYNSPYSILEKFSTNSKDNVFGYSNKNVDELLKYASYSNSYSKNVDYYDKIEKYIIDDFCYIPLLYRYQYFLMDKKADGIEFNPFTSQLYFKNATYKE